MSEKIIRSDKKTFLGIKANGPVFITSLLIIVALVSTTLIVGKPMEQWFADTQNYVSNKVGWFFILLVNALLIFALYLGFGKFSKIKIGGKDAKPEFSRMGWFAMLFSAGMGIGLLFWSVAEPIFHFNSNPFLKTPGADVFAAKTSMGITFLHWGVHAWALYAIVGVALAFFTFNKKLPLTIRSIFHPLLGDKIYGPIGDIIDIISVIATLFGLATSLGLGAQQINAGLEYLFHWENSDRIQVIIIVVVTVFATLSLILGLDKGIRKLSEWNMRLAIFLLVFMLLVGPTLFLCKSFIQNIGHYVGEFFELSFWTNTYNGVGKAKNWQSSWTVFYWAWWISWSPFVGIFIARISKGRTIKEFILGVMLVPTLLTMLWLTVFGGSAIFQELIGNHVITEAVNNNVATAIYHLLEQYPFTTFSSLLTVILVASFFVTSSDSGSFVVDTLTSGGRHDAPKGQKIFWASMEGLIAAILLIGGGLTALQTASILTAIPFAIILIVMCYSFYKSLTEYKEEPSLIDLAEPEKRKVEEKEAECILE
ncbi:choline/glycine/proline betaine transport protein [Ancylomarina subtilis]|uniref:Choline/glycine/proline betaine transport protein n=1 Tax=Ancylomarina subtilis TaxID=1639035 RepID=A0A4Q7VIT7_9BACT|nr:BCCT family transporter [Ancylomarina subtilis]RZT95974.1 choline/glycine/proline betaine transport protein [Ancylomarina subtilis]